MHNIPDKQTNLVSKINLLLAIYFLLYLAFQGQQLHGFDHCLLEEMCKKHLLIGYEKQVNFRHLIVSLKC